MRIALVSVVLVALGLVSPGAASPASELALAVESVLSGPIPPAIRQFRDFSLLFAEVTNFYDKRDFEPVWLAEGRLTEQAIAVLRVLTAADSHGLRPGDYLAARIAAGPGLAGNEPTSQDALARVELSLSGSVMRYIKDLHEGRFSPRDLKLGLDIEHRRLDLAVELQRLLQEPDPGPGLERFAPQHEGYERLRRQLIRYRRLAREASWQRLGDQIVVRPEDEYADAETLRDRLRLTGDLDEGVASTGPVYDPPLVQAVQRFQRRHGLEVDGILGKMSFAQLNRTWDDRADQIALGLERWRWVPDSRETEMIVVVIPAFQLRAFADFHDPEAQYFESRVIVGKSYSRFKTPIFRGELSYLDFRPYWNIPPSLARREIVPHLEEPGYLEENDYEIVSQFGNDVRPLPATDENLERVKRGELLLRQRPGAKNALGEVKFIFPNEHNVYLHSTPQKSLFARARRDFSHGCIRVADPVGLAEWVLSDQPGWNRRAIEQAMHDKAPTRVTVRRHLPVYILYTTAVVDLREDLLYFFEDIYGLDEQLASALGFELGVALPSLPSANADG